MAIDNLKLYRTMTLDTSVLQAIDCISSSITSGIVINPAPSTKHRFKMKTKRLRKKLYKYPHRYYEKEFADMLVYNIRGNEVQAKFMRLMRDNILYGENESRLTDGVTI